MIKGTNLFMLFLVKVDEIVEESEIHGTFCGSGLPFVDRKQGTDE